MMKRLLSCLLLAAMLAALFPAALSEEKIVYTATLLSNVNLRGTPSATGTVLNNLKEGSKVEVVENNGTWCKVKSGKRTGYMMSSYLKIEGNYPHFGWGTTADDGTVLNLRKAPEKDAPVVYKAMSGGALELVAREGSWYRVKTGNVFGYLEKSAVTEIKGDFTLGFSGKAKDAVTADSLSYALREIGDEVKEEGQSGGLEFRLYYPDLHLEGADQAISRWLGKIKAAFAKDLETNHPGASGSLRVEYKAQKISSRYQSVVLLGEYQTGSLIAQSFLTLNIDAEAGEVIQPQKIFRRNRDWVMFCLESGISSFMSTPTDGYTGKPQAEWLKYAVMGRGGMEVYLPAGLHMPASLGSRMVELTYAQLDGCLGLDEAFLAPYHREIDPEKPMVALTFDDGPSEETDRIVKVLAQYNARATFCVIGNKVESFGDVLKRTIANGNQIVSHTWKHPHLDQISAKSVQTQLEKTNEAVKAVAGYQIKGLRPPYGAVNKNVRSVCKQLDMFIITWNIDSLDWQTRSTSKTYRAIIKGAKNGNVILMHDLYSTTASAVERAVPELVEKGIQLVTVSELLSYRKEPVEAGNVYTNVDPKHMKGN